MTIRKNLLILTFWFIAVRLWAQSHLPLVLPPENRDFNASLSFLASDWMEGREAGTRGNFMAADYIASQLQLFGLYPVGDSILVNTEKRAYQKGLLISAFSYYQNFELIKYSTDKADLAIVHHTGNSESAFQFSPGVDFVCKSPLNGTEALASLVFAGYGIAAPEKGYNDYAGLNVKGRIVVVLDGYPGHADTNSISWKKLGKQFREDETSPEKKLYTAWKQGALALIFVSPSDLLPTVNQSPVNKDVVKSAMNSIKSEDPDYEDSDFALPGDTSLCPIPSFRINSRLNSQIFDNSGINLSETEQKIALTFSPVVKIMEDTKVRFSVSVKAESVQVRNIISMIPGKDTTKSILVGAHYDHLGKRNALIYNGADDNASGVSGMLALAKVWSESSEKPACNLIFASWTAEEKGLLGSSYFVWKKKPNSAQLLLYINLDMISRSEPEDTARKQLSIGTMTASNNLRKMAENINLKCPHPLKLDLWDVTGHTGSDYAPFASCKIPVMTFFSGFHSDYHTPRDIAANTDPEKMKNILKIVNDCLLEMISNIHE